MNHTLVMPVVVPLIAAALLVLVRGARPAVRHLVGLTATLLFVGVASLLLMRAADGAVAVYLLGNWRTPFGIVLVLDRLSAWMLILTGWVGLACLLAAIAGGQARAPHFHTLFQVQLAGVAGAFLTGDLFNLFVFFEVLLAASYGLLLYPGERAVRRAGLHYVVFNLIGSALFLIAASLIYGVAGTLNFADLAGRVAAVPAADLPLLRAGALLLLVVFCIKAAALPLGLWLPATYGAAVAPVAALFALLTKVGIYAILRVFTGVFAGAAAVGAEPLLHLSGLLPWAGALTLLFGTVGAFAAPGLRALAASLVLASAGTLLIAAGVGSVAGVAAAIYYAAHSTLAGASLFLIADALRRGRGEVGDRLVVGPALAQPALLGGLFFVVAVAIAGLPPLSGFLGKAMLLSALLPLPGKFAAPLAGAVLVGGLASLLALSRAGSQLFWHVTPALPGAPGRAGTAQLAAPALLLAGLAALVVLAGPAQRYALAAARQVTTPVEYQRAVMTTAPKAQPGRAP